MASTGTRTVSRPLRIGSQVRRLRLRRRIADHRFDLAAATQLGEQVHQLVALSHRGALFDQLAHVRECRGQAHVVDGLEDVVDGARFEGLHRESIVGRHENDHRQFVWLELCQHVEA